MSLSVALFEAVAANRAAVGVTLVAGALPLAPLAVLAARRIAPGRRDFFARWGSTDLLLVAMSMLAVQVLLPVAWPMADEVGTVEMLARNVITFAAPGVVAVLVAHRTEPDALAALGLRGRGSGRGILAGASAYLLLLPGVLGLGLAWPWLFERFGGEPAPQAVLVGLLELGRGELALGLALAVVVQPFLEELVFRGFLQPLLVQNLRDAGGIALTSLVFATLHGASAFLPVFGLSLLLGGVMLRTRSLWAAWAVHALHNGLTLAFFMLVPGARELVG